jgi:hypothetical protein
MLGGLSDIYEIIKKYGFETATMQVFKHQKNKIPIYKQWVNQLGITNPKSLTEIPFLPSSFFKTHKILGEGAVYDLQFTSSGTTGAVTAAHFVQNAKWYEDSFLQGFQKYYGPPNSWCIIGLLPHYLQRGNSSLVYMVNKLIAKSQHANSGFYLDDFDGLHKQLLQNEQHGIKTWLIGVTYALIDFFEKFPQPLMHTTILETGGMKGRKREWMRKEVHDFLKSKTGLPYIHGEYGMTELLSQAYMQNDGLFQFPTHARAFVRSTTNPLHTSTQGKGLLNIVDLANYNSCSFIAVDDYGEVLPTGQFTVQGRTDYSDIRGCSLMYNQD